MCMMCEGFSLEDALAFDAALIAEYGYMVTGVDGGDEPHWAYSVGFLDRAAHPELIVAGPEFVSSGKLITEIGGEIVRGRRFAAGDTWETSTGPVRFGAVDPIQHRLGTFNVWHNLASIGVLESTELVALQVFAPPTWFCRGHQECQPDLSRSESRVDVAPLRPNRAARRARWS